MVAHHNLQMLQQVQGVDKERFKIHVCLLLCPILPIVVITLRMLKLTGMMPLIV